MAACLAVAPIGSAQGAQTYFQPRVETRVEQHSNRNLSTNSDTEDDIVGYIAKLEGTWSYLTPTSDTHLRPRLRFQEYPDRKDIQRSEQALDLTTRNQVTERTRLDLAGSYSRRDAFNVELGEAEFDELDPDDVDPDDLDPDDPSDGDIGPIRTGNTRTRIRLSPGLSHQFSELTGLGLRAAYGSVRYESEGTDERRDYDSLELNAAGTRRLDPRTRISLGPYIARYETADDRNTTDSYGLTAGWDRQWSDLLETYVRLYGDRSEIELRDDVTTSTESVTNFGGELAGLYRTETGRLRYSIGRRFRPTSSGNRSVVDELRVQYDWRYSQRLATRVAVRAWQREAQGSSTGSGDRDQARAELGLTWMLTPTVYVGGGYEYTWREREQDGASATADNHTAYITFGYRGLVPRR